MWTMKRIMKEFTALPQETSPFYTNIGPIDESDMYNWRATVIGASDSPYEGGVFHLSISFPDGYPFKPPKVLFTTKVYHPNISSTGQISLDVLSDCWSPALSIYKVLLSIYCLLADPNADDNLSPEVAQVYKTNKRLFEETAKDWTKQYAH
eukprot:GILI01039666.1.p1 GENE.GILI01039666.1~~GILI01039666.1.p1  ORF type:complete len:151 (+),score=10.04 GILI01039666.1:48-500(+)